VIHYEDYNDNFLKHNCILCGKPLVELDEDKIIDIKIDGKSYYFDSQTCVNMFKRLKHVYGNKVYDLVGDKQFLIDPFWNKTIPQENEINEIELDNLTDQNIKVIDDDPKQVQKLIDALLKSTTNEILVIFSTLNAFYRQSKRYDLDKLFEGKNIKLRILVPCNAEKKPPLIDSHLDIEIRCIEESMKNDVSILIVDRKYSLSVELKNDKSDSSYESIGMATFSKSKATVLYYVSIFESLWKQADLYLQIDVLFEKIKMRDQTHKKFIDIAAHELRNPIQPILGLAEVMRTNNSLGIKQKEELLDIIISNAKKLQLFTDNLLEVNRIENKTFKLNTKRFDLIDLIKKTIKDVMQYVIEKQIVIKNTWTESLFVDGDPDRLGQVLYNLLTNAIKFSDRGTTIIVNIEKRIDGKRNELVVSVQDSGQGIDPKIKEKLFSKFTTKSNMGTGLGLYISKNIVESHGGKIWAQDNKDDKGTTFIFSIPLSE